MPASECPTRVLCRSQLLQRPLQLALLPNETFDACDRPAEDCGAPVLVADGGTMAMLVAQAAAVWEAGQQILMPLDNLPPAEAAGAAPPSGLPEGSAAGAAATGAAAAAAEEAVGEEAADEGVSAEEAAAGDEVVEPEAAASDGAGTSKAAGGDEAVAME